MTRYLTFAFKKGVPFIFRNLVYNLLAESRSIGGIKAKELRFVVYALNRTTTGFILKLTTPELGERL